jgi:hypothetical protein
MILAVVVVVPSRLTGGGIALRVSVSFHSVMA